MEPDVHFVGLVLPGHGKSVSVNEKTDSEHSIWTLHITQFALGKDPSPGRNTVSLISEAEEEFVLGTLEKDRCEQFQADFMISESVRLINSGASEVHLTGYKTTTDLLDPGAHALAGDTDEEDEDEDYEKVLARRRFNKARKALEAGDVELEGEEFSGMDTDDNEEDNEDDEDDEDDEDNEEEAPQAVPMRSGTAAIKKAILKQLKAENALDTNWGDEEDEGEPEDDSEDEEPSLAAAMRGNLVTLRPVKDTEDEVDEEEEDEEGDDEEEEEEDDEDEDEEDEDEDEAGDLTEAPQQQPNGAQKRPAELKEKTQQNKKAKVDPQATPAKAPAAGITTSDLQWARAIRAHLAKEGPTKLSAIGSAVKKPAGTSKKLKKLLDESEGFEISSTDIVSLKK